MNPLENTKPTRQLPADIQADFFAYKDKQQNIQWLKDKLDILNQEGANEELFKIAYQLTIRMNPTNKDFVREKLKEIVLAELQAAKYE